MFCYYNRYLTIPHIEPLINNAIENLLRNTTCVSQFSSILIYNITT